MKFKVTEIIGDEPVTKEEAKSHLRVVHEEEDDYIDALIKTARQMVESLQFRAIPEQKIKLFLDEFPEKAEWIKLPRPPLKELLEFKYTDKDGEEYDFEDYLLDKESAPALIYPKEYWPDKELKKTNGIEIEYRAGYDEVPETTKQVMLLLISNWYENREPVFDGTVNQIPFTVEALLNQERVFY